MQYASLAWGMDTLVWLMAWAKKLWKFRQESLNECTWCRQAKLKRHWAQSKYCLITTLFSDLTKYWKRNKINLCALKAEEIFSLHAFVDSPMVKPVVEPCAGRAAADNLWAPPPTFVNRRAAADNLSARRRCQFCCVLILLQFSIDD